MPETKNVHPPLIQKGDAWMLRAGTNARKYKCVIALREEQKLSWREIGERMHYSTEHARRMYFRAKELLEIADKDPRLQPPKGYRAKSGETGVPPLIKQEEAKFIHARINQEKYRTVLTLRDKYHLTFSKIAERTGFSKGYVVALYHKAIHLKRSVLEQSEQTSEKEKE